jgi:hypothetical protein
MSSVNTNILKYERELSVDGNISTRVVNNTIYIKSKLIPKDNLSPDSIGTRKEHPLTIVIIITGKTMFVIRKTGFLDKITEKRISEMTSSVVVCTWVLITHSELEEVYGFTIVEIFEYNQMLCIIPNATNLTSHVWVSKG